MKNCLILGTILWFIFLTGCKREYCVECIDTKNKTESNCFADEESAEAHRDIKEKIGYTCKDI